MIADYHVHTPYCGHAKGKIIDYVNTAVAEGLQEIGFSDHLGRYYLTRSQRRRYWDWGMDERNLARYVAELLDIKELFKDRISIKIGLEVDYVEGAEDLVTPIVSNYPIDYILGSVHCIPEFGWQHLTALTNIADSSVIYKEYFRLARAAMQAGIFSSLSHPDFIWRYVGWPRNTDLPYDELAALVLTASELGHPVEINANAWLWSRKNPMERDPFDFLLSRIAANNVPVSIGSDAHEPEMVGKFLGEIIRGLKEKGITSFVRFAEGNRRIETLG